MNINKNNYPEIDNPEIENIRTNIKTILETETLDIDESIESILELEKDFVDIVISKIKEKMFKNSGIKILMFKSLLELHKELLEQEGINMHKKTLCRLIESTFLSNITRDITNKILKEEIENMIKDKSLPSIIKELVKKQLEHIENGENEL